MGADPEKTYTMAQVMEMAKTMMPGGGGREMTPDMISAFLGLGAAVNPIDDDLKFYTTFSEQYKEYLKKKGFSSDRLPAPADKDGSFELWAYYHLGLPSFAMNLFTIQKPTSDKPAEGAAGRCGPVHDQAVRPRRVAPEGPRRARDVGMSRVALRHILGRQPDTRALLQAFAEALGASVTVEDAQGRLLHGVASPVTAQRFLKQS